MNPLLIFPCPIFIGLYKRRVNLLVATVFMRFDCLFKGVVHF